jgi:hypothetical protein
MIGIVLPSNELLMTESPDHPVKPEHEAITQGSSFDEESGLWLCIGDNEDIATEDPLIFSTSPLLIGDKPGDDPVSGWPGPNRAYPSLNHRKSPSRKGSP